MRRPKRASQGRARWTPLWLQSTSRSGRAWRSQRKAPTAPGRWTTSATFGLRSRSSGSMSRLPGSFRKSTLTFTGSSAKAATCSRSTRSPPPKDSFRWAKTMCFTGLQQRIRIG